MRLDLFFKAKYQSSTVILSVSIKYSVHDLLFDVSNCTSDPQTSKVRNIRQMMSALSLATARLSKLWVPFLNLLLRGDLCKNISILSIFLAFVHDFIIYMDFSFITASNTATDWWRHKLGHTYNKYKLIILLCKLCIQNLRKIWPKWRLLIRFMVILYSGLLSGGRHVYMQCILSTNGWPTSEMKHWS